LREVIVTKYSVIFYEKQLCASACLARTMMSSPKAPKTRDEKGPGMLA
jgi:hypothetical protein